MLQGLLLKPGESLHSLRKGTLMFQIHVASLGLGGGWPLCPDLFFITDGHWGAVMDQSVLMAGPWFMAWIWDQRGG